MTEPDLVKLLSRQTQRKVGLVPLDTVRQGAAAIRTALAESRGAGVSYAICDAETQDDLGALAAAAATERVLLGSSALAEELPGVWIPPEEFDPLAGLDLGESGGTLVIAASVMPQTQAQIGALEAAGATILTLSNEEALRDPERAITDLTQAAVAALQAGKNTVVRSENRPYAVDAARRLGAELGLDGVAVSRRISTSLAKVADQVLAATGSRRLITLGGDTSAAVCRQLGITETVVLQEIQPGLPSTLAPGARPLLLVLKSGSFGAPDFVLKAIDHLRRLA